MASWLAIDWDYEQFHLLSVQTSRRGVQITQAVSWPHPEPFTASTADRVGKALRDFLKTQKIAAAPVLVGLGRDRLILKELRFPAIPPHEEAALVRFQTAKELTESADRYAIDYAYLNGTKDTGSREVMSAAVKRDVVTMIETLCLAAGLKLHAITPRLFGAGVALAHAVHPDPSPLTPDRWNVALSLGQRWAELCFFRGDRLVQAQAVANGPLLVSEVKRNLAVFQAQHAVELEVKGPECLHLFGDDPAIVQALQTGLNMPVVELDPLEKSPELAAKMKNPAAFGGALGLALLWTNAKQTPVNLAAPKKHYAPTSAGKQRGIVYGAVAATVLFFLFGGLYYVLAGKQAEVARLANQKRERESQLKKLAQERADVEGYRDWEATTVSWLDEIYDLTARHPFEKGFRVGKFEGMHNPKKKDSTTVARIKLVGYTPDGKEEYVKELHAKILPDPHLLSKIEQTKLAPGAIEYHMLIDVAKQPADKYVTRFSPPPPLKAKVIEKWKDAPKQEVKKLEEKKEEPKDEAQDPDGEKQ